MIGGVEFFRDISELEHLRTHIINKKTLNEIVSVNPHMQQLTSLLSSIAESDCNVLIQGPSGSGKELFAQVIHNLSSRRYSPYIKINCAALPAQLLESELFGYEKGAFTDAKRNKPGQFCLANGGTLLLDEISEMDVSLQVKLLRVLNNGEYRPLGSSKVLYSDARIIAATNSDLKQEIKNNRFREDLYYRINVMSINIPPLKDRPEDIPLLVNHFLKLHRQKSRNPVERITPKALSILRKYRFPGNVRELENAIEHAFVLCRSKEILPEHLPESILKESNAINHISNNGNNERGVILESLTRNQGNKSRTAIELGIHRSTLWRKMKSFGIGM
jgi:transcriptional regulator with PAS, ATPase and Fis domain